MGLWPTQGDEKMIRYEKNVSLHFSDLQLSCSCLTPPGRTRSCQPFIPVCYRVKTAAHRSCAPARAAAVEAEAEKVERVRIL
jgi:hypothetical protein